jgi:hypothetical protein
MKIISAVARDTELSVIGVQTNGQPSASTFPKNFSTDGFKVWRKIFDDPWFAELKAQKLDTSEVWFQLVQHYLKLCSKNGIYPFKKANQQTQNETVASFLESSRRRLVTFADLHKVFDKVKIQSVTRSYEFRANSFVLSSEALLKPVQDPTFVNWLKSYPGPNFIRGDEPGLFNKHVQSNVDFFFKTANLNQVKVGFRIFCHTPLATPDYSKLPSKAKLTQIAESSIWLPIVRNNRFKNAGSRLF